MLINLKELLRDSHGGVASFNCIDLEMAKGCLLAAEKLKRPVVIGVATRHWMALGGKEFVPSLVGMCKNAKVPVALHLDHAKPTEKNIVEEALASGFTSIMIDGSSLSFEENVALTKEVIAMCRPFDASVEAELGPILGEEGVAGVVDASKSKNFTNPSEAKSFCEQTLVDALAIAVGTAHGIYKDVPKIQLDLINEIGSLTSTPLVLHGATGIPDEVIRESVKRGIRKVNFFSGLLTEAMDSIRKVKQEDTDYMALRLTLRKTWERVASDMISLYA